MTEAAEMGKPLLEKISFTDKLEDSSIPVGIKNFIKRVTEERRVEESFFEDHFDFLIQETNQHPELLKSYLEKIFLNGNLGQGVLANNLADLNAVNFPKQNFEELFEHIKKAATMLGFGEKCRSQVGEQYMNVAFITLDLGDSNRSKNYLGEKTEKYDKLVEFCHSCSVNKSVSTALLAFDVLNICIVIRQKKTQIDYQQNILKLFNENNQLLKLEEKELQLILSLVKTSNNGVDLFENVFKPEFFQTFLEMHFDEKIEFLQGMGLDEEYLKELVQEINDGLGYKTTRTP